MEQVSNGVVKWFNGKKGYGFISMGTEEIFVHFSGIKDNPNSTQKFKNLSEGDHVQFRIDPNGKKGPQAVDVEKVAVGEN